MSQNERWTDGPERVVLVDLGMRGARHGPFNAMLLRTVAAALPDVPTEFWSEAAHGQAVRALNQGALNQGPASHATFHAIELWDRYPGKDELVTLDRLWSDLRLLRSVVQARSGRTLLVVSSLSSTGLVAAGLLQRLLGRRRVRVQFVMHGNLASLRHGWRPRNPLHRALGLATALRHAPNAALRVLVLEETVAAALQREIPETTGHTDVLPHPANEDEAPGPTRLNAIPRVAMVGLATRAKGAEAFLRMAARLHDGLPGRIELRVVGRLHPDLAQMGLPGQMGLNSLAQAPEAGELDRAEFISRVRAQDYVCLPYGGSYYELAASGSLLDAISCARPVVALDGPLVRSLFDRFGEIGYLCQDEAEMLDVFRHLATLPDEGRYAAQVRAMMQLRDTRLPGQLAPQYRHHLSAVGAL